MSPSQWIVLLLNRMGIPIGMDEYGWLWLIAAVLLLVIGVPFVVRSLTKIFLELDDSPPRTGQVLCNFCHGRKTVGPPKMRKTCPVCQGKGTVQT